ncbi:MAG TPA: ABC transporter ATP-binding protein [Acidimicrobiales bacterium]|nr:ABC transporter ATP-binding protein [Acidimicrobiales bacterium]
MTDTGAGGASGGEKQEVELIHQEELDDDTPPPVQTSWAELHGWGAQAEQKKDWRKLPHMVAVGVRLVWNAARWRAVTVALLQGFSGLALGPLILSGQSLLQRALTVRDAGGVIAELAPQAIQFGVISALIAVMQAFSMAQQRVIIELVGTHGIRQVMATAAAVDLARYEDSEFFDQLQRASTGGQMRPWQLTMALTEAIAAVLGTVGIGIALYSMKPILVPLAVISAVPIWLATIRNARGRYWMQMENIPEDRERIYMQRLLTEREPAKEVRAFNLVDYLRDRHLRLTRNILVRTRRESWKESGRSLIGRTAAGIATVAGGVTLLWLLVSGGIKEAAAFSAAIAMQQLRQRVQSTALSAGGVYESALFLDDYQSFLDMRPQGPEPIPLGSEEIAVGTTPLATPESSVPAFETLRAERVTFAYPGSNKNALEEIDFEMKAGQVVALVGENGSGKTTLAKILGCLYAPTAGRIMWDGIDMTSMPPEVFREHCTVIFQDYTRYALPAKDNIGLGRHQRIDDIDAIREAAQITGVDRVFDRLAEGWDTTLGRQFWGGQDLSGGQWQRVALSRAFFRDSAFLVLDEPTASLDARAEARLFEKLRHLAKGRSVLLITHRFGNVRMADRIYVLTRGRVSEAGSHDELMAAGGQYAELFNLQASQFLGDPAPV